jgi:ferredoxin--NADP+ reductase
VSHTEIDVSGTTLVGACQPGQSIGVQVPGVDERGRAHKIRLYSLCSPSAGEHGNPAIIATTVKRLIDRHWEDGKLFLGVASNHICDLAPGDEILVTGPAGKRFLLPKDVSTHEYVFFATGTGIAPFRAMVLELLGEGCPNRITLVAGAPYATDLMYHQDFLELARANPNFTYLPTVSRERQEDGHEKLYVQDRIRTNRDALGPQLAGDGTLLYICGITGMEIGIFQQMALALTDDQLAQYLSIDEPIMKDAGSWTRSMINRQIRPTGRVLMEVYD